MITIIGTMNNFECTICYEKRSLSIKTKCGHDFCICCVRKVLKELNPRCPLCRGKFSGDVIDWEPTVYVDLKDVTRKHLQNDFP